MGENNGRAAQTTRRKKSNCDTNAASRLEGARVQKAATSGYVGDGKRISIVRIEEQNLSLYKTLKKKVLSLRRIFIS